MATNEFFKREFDKLSVNGVIGDPSGKPAFSYLRVSSQGQSSKNHSGMDRQVGAIHRCAKEHGFSISWDMLFSDDESGFTWTNRYEFVSLLEEIRTPTRRSNVIFCESADRLSRDEYGERGFLLKERIEKFGAKVVFADGWTRPSTDKEKELAKAKEGIYLKAERGQITAKVPALGFKFVDSRGKTNTPESKSETYYAIDSSRVPLIEFIYHSIAYSGMSVFELQNALDEKAKTDPAFKPPRAKAWNEQSLIGIIRNTVYRGEYIANRVWHEKIQIPTGEGERTKPHHIRHEKDESEWIRISVPAIVSEETWELANKNLYRNKGFTKRGRVNQYLLSGLLRCKCGRRFHGSTDRKGIARYYCASRYDTPGQKEIRKCDRPSIHCDTINNAVLSHVREFFDNPEKWIKVYERMIDRQGSDDTERQIEYLQGEIARIDKDDERLKQAYLSEILTLEEYGRDRKNLTIERDKLTEAIKRLERQIELAKKSDKKIEELRELLEDHKRADHVTYRIETLPLDYQQKILRMLIDEIVLDTTTMQGEMAGRIGHKTYTLAIDENGASNFNIKPQKWV